MRPLLAILGLIIVAIVASAVIATNRTNTSSPTTSEQHEEQYPSKPEPKPLKTQALSDFEKVKAGAIRATLEIEGKGTMTLELYPQAAPKTVEHFVDLCKHHFYEGILVHRVAPDFVIQMGDPTSKRIDQSKLRGLSSDEAAAEFRLGMAGSGKTVPLEAHLPHDKYSVGLARSNAPDSGDSQFYINLKDNHDIDGEYCIFGRVISGQDITQKIEIGDRIKRLAVQ